MTTQEHLDSFTDFTDLEEVDHEDAIMRLLTQSFIGEVKKWSRSLNPGPIQNFDQFQELLLEKWEIKKNYLQLLTHYNNLKRNPMESGHEF